MNPWFVHAGVVLIPIAPMVALLVIITEYAGNSLAEFRASPFSEHWSSDSERKRPAVPVMSEGLNQLTVLSLQ